MHLQCACVFCVGDESLHVKVDKIMYRGPHKRVK